jgi:hypothetical protein
VRHTLSCSYLLLAVLGFTGCNQDHKFQQHQEKLESLGATTAAIGEAWLSGHVSGRYAATALEQTMRLVEKERTAVASEPQALSDPTGARLSQTAERLSRLLAMMMRDVAGRDDVSFRRRLDEIPVASVEPR